MIAKERFGEEDMQNAVIAAFVGCVLLAGTIAQAQQPSPPANPMDVVPDQMPFDVPYGAPIVLDRAKEVAAAAEAEAKKHNWKMNISVMDSGGNLVAFERMDGAQLASIAISQHKAHAALIYRRETKIFENAVNGGQPYALSLDGVIASRGGIPLVEGGKIIGAIGVSGGTGSQDEVVSKAGAALIK
jgi:glc operon protein GlcG